MAQCEFCGQWDGKHSPSCPFYKGEVEKPSEPPIVIEKEYCSLCGELVPNHKTTCPLYGGGLIPGEVVPPEDPPTTSEPIRGVGDKICTNKEIYEFADDSSRPSKGNQCPSKGKWNNKRLGRWTLSIDDHIKDKQLFALKNVVKELTPINLVMYFDITSSRDADNLIFNFEVMNTNTNPNLLTEYTKNGIIVIYGYHLDKTDNSWREFVCTYRYSNETSDQFRFKETGINISKEKKYKEKYSKIQQPATGEYHNIDSWIEAIYLDGRLVYNSNYPVSLHDNTTDNPVNLTFNISGNTDTSRPIIMEINAGYLDNPKARVYLNESDVEVKNPALYSCTAYIQYNGSIVERDNTDGSIKIKGHFTSTYKLVYDPKTSNDSTLSVERLSFDIYTQDGSPYNPTINEIVILDVKINKFESSGFNSMKLYYPDWSKSGYKYNMVSTTAP